MPGRLVSFGPAGTKAQTCHQLLPPRKPSLGLHTRDSAMRTQSSSIDALGFHLPARADRDSPGVSLATSQLARARCMYQTRSNCMASGIRRWNTTCRTSIRA